jgi:hypothetical protein
MLELLTPILEKLNSPALVIILIVMMFRLNTSISLQRTKTVEEFHTLDKRVTLIEAEKSAR